MTSALLIDDATVIARLTPRLAVETMRRELSAHARGETSNPPRSRVSLDEGAVVFTVGSTGRGGFGFRAYETRTAHDDQAVVVWSPDGWIRAVAVGVELGAARTGAIGAVAVDALARPEASSLAVIGAGRQAWWQVWAIAAVRPLRSVRVFSPTPASRAGFADRVRRELALPAEATSSAREAVTSADIVVLATTSHEPVIAADWIAPGAHVTTAGPKAVDGHELPLDLPPRAGPPVVDSIAQAHAYPRPHILGSSPLVSLGDILTGRAPGRGGAEEITLFASVGLSGTEVALAEALAAHLT